VTKRIETRASAQSFIERHRLQLVHDPRPRLREQVCWSNAYEAVRLLGFSRPHVE
jgi:hypothetical protein